MDILKQLNWRYATKKFDLTRTIPPQDLHVLTEALRLSPSSLDLQPWHFVVISNKELREKLKPITDGQAQATDASHMVVLCIKNKIDESHIDAHIRSSAEARGVSVESLQKYRERLLTTPETKSPATYRHWATAQAYLAAGMLLATAAYMGIDSCPMEGFDAKAYDKELGLKKRGLHAVLVITLGYRSMDDERATTKKVRFDRSDVISQLD